MSTRKVLWKNGTLLAPQHLQQADRHLEALLLRHGPFSWGVIEVQADPQALAQGKFGLRRFRAVLPDGMSVDIGRDRAGREGSDEAPQQGEITFPAGIGQLGIWLAIPERISDGRFIEEQQATADDYNPANVRPVLVGKKNLRYVFAGQARQGLSSLQIAALERDASGRPVLDAGFIPTCLALSASPWFGRFLRTLTGKIEGRIREIALRLHRDSTEECTLFLLHQHVPLLRHFDDPEVQQAVHPLRLFEVLLQLAGGLSAAAADLRPLPAYTHRDQTSCFTALAERLEALLATRGRTRVRDSIQLEVKERDAVFWAGSIKPESLTPDSAGARIRMFLVLSGEDVSYQQLVGLVTEQGKLGGSQHLREAYGRAWPGLAVEFVPKAPLAGVTPLGAIYFQLRMEQYPLQRGDSVDSHNLHALWSEIRETGAISFYLPAYELAERLPRVDILIVQDEGQHE